MTAYPGEIFVFGSNLAGRHGAGAALAARQNYGAILGRGSGLMGQSYAIPTKDHNLRTLDLPHIRSYVTLFIEFTHRHPELAFYITPVGCGLAGYDRQRIWPAFLGVGENCRFADTWWSER